MQIDLEEYFRRFGEIQSLRLRRTDTGLFKGSIIVQFHNQSDADKVLAKSHEWNGCLLEAKTKAAWVQGKIEESEKLSPEERKEREKREHGARSQKRFSAFKAMEKKEQELLKKVGRKTERQARRGRGAREDKPRGRSRSPAPTEKTEELTNAASVPATAGEKRARTDSPVGEAPSLFSNKREKLDRDSGTSKRAADEELNGETKKAKVEE